LRTNSGEVALGLLLDRGGAAYLPEAMSREYLDAERLFAVEHAPVISRLAYVVYRPECLDRASMQQAMKALKWK
jgi:DNA-binding transcriptional LysR family regulator